MKPIYLLLFFMIGMNTNGNAQREPAKKKENNSRFRISMMLGAYGVQVDGDSYNGYDKLGWSAGVRATTILSEHWYANVEVLYQEKGSVFETVVGGAKDRELHLVYVEVPFLLRYLPSDKGLGLYLETGMAYSRLVRSKVVEELSVLTISYEDIAQDFISNELSTLFGLGYQFTPHLSLGARYSFSLKRFYNNPEGVYSESFSPSMGEQVTLLRNYMVGAYVAYTF